MSNDKAFTPPPAAKPFSPENLKKDPERTVAGLDTSKPLFDTAPVVEGPVVHRHMNLSGTGDPHPDTVAPSGTSATPPPAAEAAAPVPSTIPAFCPACGHNMKDVTPIEIPTDEDKQDWLRYVLGAKRFYKTYEAMGGKLKVTLRTRLGGEVDDVFKQLRADIDSGKIQQAMIPATDAAYMTRLSRLLLTVSLAKLEAEGQPVRVLPELTEEAYPKSGEKDERTLVIRAHDALFKDMGEALLSIIVHQLRRFEAMTATMVRRSADVNFWLPAGGAS